MSPLAGVAIDAKVAPIDKTGRTDDERIKEVTPLPPPEHFMRRYPIRGTAAERLVIETANPVADRVPTPHGSGTGLIGVAERVEILGGTVDVDRSSDQFRLTVSLPWSR